MVLYGGVIYTEDMAQAIVGLELADLQAALGPEQPAFRARQVYDAVYRQRVADLVQITSLPVSLRKELASRLAVGLPAPAAEYKSTDGTRRYLLELEDRRTVETVLMPEEGRGHHLHFEPGGLSGQLPVLPDGADGTGAESDGRRDRRPGAVRDAGARDFDRRPTG